MGKPAAEFVRLAKEALDVQPHEYLLFDMGVACFHVVSGPEPKGLEAIRAADDETDRVNEIAKAILTRHFAAAALEIEQTEPSVRCRWGGE